MDISRLQTALETATAELLSRRTPDGHWVGRLSGSALSTATAVSAFSIFYNAWHTGNPVGRKKHRDVGFVGATADTDQAVTPEELDRMVELLRRGVDWLIARQNTDGGWGDTSKSFSNVSTTLLVKSALVLSDIHLENHLLDDAEQSSPHEPEHNSMMAGWSMDRLARADLYLRRAGGIAAVQKRYGKDKTFSAPILTNAALAGLVPWKDVVQLPFERAALHKSLFRLLNLQVVSYAIPALVAIGQVRFHYQPEPGRPISRFLRRRAVSPTLRLIERMQPDSGGYLEAAPLTAFVVMSLVACGHLEHPVVVRGLRFLLNSAREDGSWPIDTNLATWATTLSINALGAETFENDPSKDTMVDWLLSCQHRKKHPFTGAKPGGWGWTDLSGAVPDGDDTPGALIALSELWPTVTEPERRREILQAVKEGLRWLLKLQNADGGMPTFCRGWGVLPFDKSSTDLTAHTLRAFDVWMRRCEEAECFSVLRSVIQSPTPMLKMYKFLLKTQNADGSWHPLWFGNQEQPDDVNPFYGTAKVLQALTGLKSVTMAELFGKRHTGAVRKALDWIVRSQKPDGSWGSVEETALLVETLAKMQDGKNLDIMTSLAAYRKGLQWLVEAVESGRWTESSPIGLYFAKLWYYEETYPIIFTTAALRTATETTQNTAAPVHGR